MISIHPNLQASPVDETHDLQIDALGCHVLLSDPYLSPAEAEDLGVELTDLDVLFARSTIVSLHAPLLPSTREIITARHLALKMR